jgi:hypothetical protein
MTTQLLTQPRTHAAPPATSRYRGARPAAWILFGLLFFDLWALHPFMSAEFRRLEPWKLALLLMGDCVCLLWFCWYFVLHGVLNQPLIEKPIDLSRRTGARWFFISLILGLSGDLLATVYFGYRERIEYDHATPILATVDSMHTRHASEGLDWEFTCHFVAADGRAYQTLVRLHLTPGDPFPTTFPRDLRRKLDANQTPAQIPIRYQPTWPARAWTDGVREDENGLTWFSIAMIFFQAMATLLVMTLSWKSFKEARRRGVTPWWLDLHRAVPAALQILVMAFFGMLVRLLA